MSPGFDVAAFEAIVHRIEKRIAAEAMVDTVPEVDWAATERAVHRFERAIRELRSSMRALNAVPDEVGISSDVTALERAISEVTAVHRRLKREFHEITTKRSVRRRTADS